MIGLTQMIWLLACALVVRNLVVADAFNSRAEGKEHGQPAFPHGPAGTGAGPRPTSSA